MAIILDSFMCSKMEVGFTFMAHIHIKVTVVLDEANILGDALEGLKACCSLSNPHCHVISTYEDEVCTNKHKCNLEDA